MSTDVAHATTEAGPCRIGSPGGLPVAAALQGLHQPVLGVFDHDLANLAQLPATHHLTRLAYGGIARVVVREREQRRAGCNEANQLFPLGERQREGFVTDDMNACR